MRVLVTGVAGFIGTHLRRHLGALGADVTGIDLPDCNILDTARLTSILTEARPDAVYHLAAVSSVAESWESPMQTWETNVLGTASVLEAVRTAAPAARTLIMSTASVYDGVQFDAPVDEYQPVRPISPYGTSKAATELMSRHYFSAYGMHIVLARPYNVIGPGQSVNFVVPALCQRILTVAEADRPSITIGNLDATRDFIDVREAVVALAGILDRGQPGETYNVCTGTGTSIGTLAKRLGALRGVRIDVQPDATLRRRLDPRRLVGDPTRTRREIGWSTKIPLPATLADVLTDAHGGNGRAYRFGGESPWVEAGR